MGTKRVPRKDIAVLGGSGSVRRFLESFFSESRSYRPRYFKEAGTFLKYLHETPPAAVIAAEPLLSAVADKITRYPVAAIITGDIETGIEAAINAHVKCYLYKPYFNLDLEHKLEAIILEKDLIVRMENELRELEEIAELTRFVSATLDPREVLYRIVRKIADIMPVTRCSIIKVDWLNRSAFVVASFEDPRIAGLKLSLKKYPEIMEALTSKKPVVIHDINTDPLMKRVRKIILPLGIRSILVIPIFFRDRVIGTLFLRTSRSQHAFSQNEIRLLNTIAGASANSLHNAFLFEQVEDEKSRLEKLAITDYLTGIYNVRFFYHRIIEEFSRAQRYGLPICCLMVDIDHFKRVNDIYGHRIGDDVLREFALLLKKHTRQSDVLARYGGEEFIILLPQTARDGALAEAERIRKYIKQHRFRSLKNKGGVTVSGGLSVFPNARIKSHDDLISLADKALFTAKNRGRDQVAVFGE